MKTKMGLAQYDRMVVRGHESQAWTTHDPLSYFFSWDCSCGASGRGFSSYEYALAAKRRHLRAMHKKQGGK